jgi:hypothetical protein
LPIPYAFCSSFRSGCLLPFHLSNFSVRCTRAGFFRRGTLSMLFHLPSSFSFPGCLPGSLWAPMQNLIQTHRQLLHQQCAPPIYSLFVLCIPSQCRCQKWAQYVIIAPFRASWCLGTPRAAFPRSSHEYGVLPWKRADPMNCLQVKQSSICTLKF